jgi:biopolymer transport protein ExbD
VRFFIRKRKQTPGVIIVALIDVLIVLLIFLMVTTTFRQQPALRLALPESNQAQKSGANENAPLVVSIDAKGNLRLGADNLPVTDARLKQEMLTRAAKDPQLRVAISADRDAPFGKFVKVRDAVMDANIKIKSITVYVKEAAQP